MNAPGPSDPVPVYEWELDAARLLAPDLSPAAVLTLPGWSHVRDWTARNPAARLGRLPDAVIDTTRKRKRRARAPIRRAADLRDTCARLYGSADMVLLTARLDLTLPELYGQPGREAARRVFVELAPGVPLMVWPEWGETGNPHAHALAPVHLAPVARAAGLHVAPVTDLRGLVCYLSKPLDARLARSKHRRAPELPALLAGLADLIAARDLNREHGAARLPAKWQTVGMSRPSATRTARRSRRKAQRRAARRAAVSAARRARSEARARLTARPTPQRPALPRPVTRAALALAVPIRPPSCAPWQVARCGNGPAP